MSAQLRQDKLAALLSGEETKVQVGRGSLPKSPLIQRIFDPNVDGETAERKGKVTTSKELAAAKLKRKTDLLRSHRLFKRI